MTEKREPGVARPDLIIDPLDYLILDQLPIEGTLHFGAYAVGKTAAEIGAVIAQGQVSHGTIGARLRVMSEEGWTLKMRGIGSGSKNIWQRTHEGEKALHRWKGEQGDT